MKKNAVGITYQAIYEPDPERMVKATRILIDYKPRENKTEKSECGDKGNK